MELITVMPETIKVRQGLPRLREEYGDVTELTMSIKTNGQIHPILVSRDSNGMLELVAGGRRLAACIQGGISIDCVVRESLTDVELRTLELEENLARKDLTWQERTRGVAELHELKQKQFGEKKPGRNQSGWSITDTAKVTGVEAPRVHQHLTLAEGMKAFPQIAKAPTEADARKLMKNLYENILIAELIERKKAQTGEQEMTAKFAENHFIIEDVFKGMAKLPDSIFDFANVDTPYGIDLTKNKKIQTGVRTDADYTEWTKEDFIKMAEGIALEVKRVLKPDAFMVWWFGIEWYTELFNLLREVGFEVDKIPAIWYGGQGQSQTMQPEMYLGRSYETMFICRKGKPIMQARGRSNVFHYDKLAAQYKIHPTEKPLALMQAIHDTFVIPGSLCISPLIGSGNDLRAWYSKGSAGIGFDLDTVLKNKFLLRVEEDLKSGLYKTE